MSSLCQTTSDSEGEVAYLARSIDTHAFLPWRLLSIELVTVWRGFDSLRPGQGRAIDDGNTYFPFFPPNRSGNSAQQKALHLFSRGLGGGGRAIDGRNIYFLFSIFFSKQEWHLCILMVV